jgi:hypothetical protein
MIVRAAEGVDYIKVFVEDGSFWGRTRHTLSADCFGLTDRGRIAPGLRADLLLVDGDPTSDITATRDIRAVWRGHPIRSGPLLADAGRRMGSHVDWGCGRPAAPPVASSPVCQQVRLPPAGTPRIWVKLL